MNWSILNESPRRRAHQPGDLRISSFNGHDCIHAEAVASGMSDADLLKMAVEQRRVILTADKGFGELVFRQRVSAVGVILLRFRVPSEPERTALFQAHWPIIERSVPGHFVVATNRRVRRTPLPPPVGFP